jgi:broad specificity phosphatase PhoE
MSEARLVDQRRSEDVWRSWRSPSVLSPQSAAISHLFQPQTSVRGWEPAADAQARIVHAVEQVMSQASDGGDVAILGHGGTGTLLYCHLAGVPISRRHEQPATNGGNWFAFDRVSRKLPHLGWRSIDDRL